MGVILKVKDNFMPQEQVFVIDILNTQTNYKNSNKDYDILFSNKEVKIRDNDIKAPLLEQIHYDFKTSMFVPPDQLNKMHSLFLSWASMLFIKIIDIDICVQCIIQLVYLDQ